MSRPTPDTASSERAPAGAAPLSPVDATSVDVRPPPGRTPASGDGPAGSGASPAGALAPSPAGARAPSPAGARGPSPARAPAVSVAGLLAWARRHWMTLAAMVLVAVPFLFLAVPLLAHRGPFSNWGDGAATELAVQNAARLRQTLGPYDRFGWSHPGPAEFYLLAIPYALMGWNPVALLAGSALVNLAAALGIVAVVARRVGGRAALGAAGALCVFGSFLGPYSLSNVWNPVLIILPTALFLVLCADVAVGGTWSLIGAVAVGSFVVQTHIGTVAAVAVALTLCAAVRGAKWRRADAPGPVPPGSGGSDPGQSAAPAGSDRFARAAAAAGLAGVLIWGPPLVQQLTGHPRNLSQILTFFLHGHGHHSPRQAFSALANGMVAHLPADLGMNAGTAHGHDGWLVAVLVAVVGIALASWWQRQWLALALAVGVLPVAAVFFLSLLRVQGDIVGYLVVWTESITFCAALALIVLVLAPRHGAEGGRAIAASAVGRAWVARLGVGVLVLAVGGASWRLSAQTHRFRVGQGYQTVTQATDAATRLLPAGANHVLVCITSADAWPSAAGMVANLRRRGLDVRVGRHWLYILGRQLAPTGHEQVALFVESTKRPAPPLGVPPQPSLRGGDLYLRLKAPPSQAVSDAACPPVP